MTDRVAAAVRDSVGRLETFDPIGTGQARVDRVASIRRVFSRTANSLSR